MTTPLSLLSARWDPARHPPDRGFVASWLRGWHAQMPRLVPVSCETIRKSSLRLNTKSPEWRAWSSPLGRAILTQAIGGHFFWKRKMNKRRLAPTRDHTGQPGPQYCAVGLHPPVPMGPWLLTFTKCCTRKVCRDHLNTILLKDDMSCD